ncbi:Glutaredoxin-like protein, YruB-family [Geosporobacter subterraneus DSM 17957]|uniref:Glutaredoxin-like protein, YruB-family n=1 Tax=Geosporobacter subterraneus DSM 17957 TaxID=1121919 RepID=A0A1M6LNF3_9FIRM|nr:glutaredoxin domain-containing protein [Geosporobacter subterraneus]SHJ72726.1 Glutaredoxin-like protein, YruB-family [Geosporobacter subterraneus DSM 17957]
MDKNVVIYSSDSCIYCREAKNYFRSIGVEFEERNVSKDVSARKELMAKGFMGVPVIMVDQEIIQGFDKRKLDELLR